MIPVEPAVNSSSSIEAGLAGVMHTPNSIRRQRPFGDATQQNDVQMHNSPNREHYLASIALSSLHRSRRVSSGKAPFMNLVCRARSRFSRMRPIARDLKARGFPLRPEQGNRSHGHTVFRKT
jgi:hypothetical protein